MGENVLIIMSNLENHAARKARESSLSSECEQLIKFENAYGRYVRVQKG